MSQSNDSELFKVPGQVAVITGGGTSIGLMMARALADNGAKKVYIVGRRLEKLQEAADRPNIVPVQGDVTDKSALARIAEQVKNESGYVNLVVANSGISGPYVQGVSESASISEVQRHMWNWSSEDLLDAGNKPGNGPDYHSQILFTASLAAFARRVTTGFAYSTSKAATTHLAKSMSTFLAVYSIRVNALSPGIFLSEMTQGIVGSTSGFGVNTIPAGRLGSEDDVRGMILWLAGRAGAYVNGMVVLLDGGRLSQQPSTY